MNCRKFHPSHRLIVFSRYPIPGRTKTRLISAIGPAGAADLQRRLTEKTMATVRAAASRLNLGVEVCFAGGSERKMRRWLGSDTVFSRQVAGDLGERMCSAFAEAFQNGCSSVVLLGSDIPRLGTDHLEQAYTAIKEHDLVLGPSSDGGYWLIALRKPANLFMGINWGTEAVLGQTLALAKRQNLKFHLLEPLTDIDTVQGLKRWRPEEAEQRPYISVIIPTLNEAENIEAAIHSAHDEDVEVIVVDAGSSDSTAKKATAAGARVTESLNSRAFQQNRGAALALGRVLLFLHADTLLPHGYVGHIFEAMMDPKTVGGAFRFKTDLDSSFMKATELMANIRSRYLKLPYGDQALFVRKSSFESLGGFPEVPIAEDFYFVRRLRSHGRLQIVPADAVTSARRWQTLGPLRTMLINWLIVIGCYLGVSHRVLASLYKVPRRDQ